HRTRGGPSVGHTRVAAVGEPCCASVQARRAMMCASDLTPEPQQRGTQLGARAVASARGGSCQPRFFGICSAELVALALPPLLLAVTRRRSAWPASASTTV